MWDYIINSLEYHPYNNNLNLPVQKIGYNDCPFKGYKLWFEVYEDSTGLYPVSVYYPLKSSTGKEITVIIKMKDLYFTEDWVDGKKGLFNEKISKYIILSSRINDLGATTKEGIVYFLEEKSQIKNIK